MAFDPVTETMWYVDALSGVLFQSSFAAGRYALDGRSTVSGVTQTRFISATLP